MNTRWAALLVLVTACSEGNKPAPVGASSVEPSGGAVIGSAAPTTPAVPVPAPDAPTHYASPTPPAKNAQCAPLPAAKNELSPIAAAIRRLSCEPELYYLSSPKLRQELALPAEVTLEFAGTSAVSLQLPKKPARELAAAMGLEKPVAVRSKTGAWGYRMFFLATEGKERPEIWDPGRISIGVAVDRSELDDAVESVPLGDGLLTGWIAVSMPEEVLPVIDDRAAMTTLRAALAYLAENPDVLAKEPEEVARLAGLVGDRFRVTRRSIGTGPDAIKGIDIWAARTRVAAGDVIDALGAKGTIEHNQAHDSDDYLLYSGSKSSFVHRSLDVTLSFEERPAKEAAGRHGKYVLNGVFLMPVGTK